MGCTGGGGGDAFILCANNEYADPTMMFPSVARMQDLTPAQMETTLLQDATRLTTLLRPRRELQLVTAHAHDQGVGPHGPEAQLSCHG